MIPMRHQHHRFFAFLFVLFALFLAPSQVGYAQTTTCSNGTIIEVEGGYTLDWAALCAAGQPWQDKGVQVVIYLTNFRPETEDDWYDHLDAAEVELGLISADRTVDDFASDVLAIEATTHVNSDFGATITFGNKLWGTPLDSDTAVQTIKADMLYNLQRENYTEALVSALEQSYNTNYPPPSLAERLGGLLAIVVIVGSIVAVINYFWGHKIRQRWYNYQSHKRLTKQIADAGEAITNLLALFDGFIEAPAPEDSLLYRIYFTQGADKYDDLLDTAVAHIRETQTNLRHAFNQWQQMPLPEDTTLEKQLDRIRALYLKLIGSLLNEENLTDDKVREQFEPFFTAADATYAEELSALQAYTKKQLTFPIYKPNAEKIKPGILDEIIHFKVELLRLIEAKEKAKPTLKAIHQEVDEMRTKVPSDFILGAEELFAPIESILAEADDVLANGRYLDIPPYLTKANEGLDTIEYLDELLQAHEDRSQQIVDLGAEGIHPPILMTLENELSLNVEPIADAFRTGQYEAVEELMLEFELDSEYALEETKTWQTLQQNNQAKIAEVQNNLSRLNTYRDETSTPAWETLQQFHQSNWQDLAEAEKETAVTLQQIEEKLPSVIAMNQIENEVQQFDAVEATLTVLAAQLVHAEFQLEAIAYRLEEVQAAEKSLPKAMQLTTTELEETITLRDAEDAKIGPKVDDAIKDATIALQEANEHIAAKNFRAAIVAQSQVRQLARHAHSTATTEVDKINTLLEQLSNLQTNVDHATTNALRDAQAMHESVLTTAVSESAKEAEAQWSIAQVFATETAELEDKDWADALGKAIIAYQAAEKSAQTAQSNIEAAHREYQKLRDDAIKAIQKAQAAIKDAQSARLLSGTGISGEHALNQARTTMAQLPSTSGMPTKETLKRIKNEAARIAVRASSAAKLAREANRKHRAAQARKTSSTWGSSSGSSWSSSSSRSSSFSSRSSSRSSFSSSRSRSSGSTSSRRRR